MGCHTWFVKDSGIYLKYSILQMILNSVRNNEIELNSIEYEKLLDESFNLYKQNKTEYHDLFRTNKLTESGEYTDDVIYSREECFEWINNPDNKVHFGYSVHDTDNQQQCDIECAMSELNRFWDEYPNGVIYFG